METAIDWLTQWGTSQKDSGRAIIVDENNRYVYATGYTSGSLFAPSAESNGTQNVWIAKFYARSGEQIWLQQLTSADDTTQTSNGIALDESGVYVAIETTHNDDITSSAIAKFALEEGTQQETYSFQSENDVSNSIHALVADGSGYLYATGYVAGSMLSETGAVLDSAGGDDAWIAKLTVDGHLIWVVQLGSDADDRANGIAIDDRGNVYVVGYTTGVMPGIETATSDKTENADNLEDTWIAKYTSDGSRDWIVQFGSNDNDRPTGVTVDESGGVYAIGKTEDSLTDDPREDGSGERAWVAKFRASLGERVWLEQLSHTNSSDNKNTEGTSIAVDNYGGVYIAGWTTGQLTTDATNTNNDAWIAKYSAPTGAQIWLEHVASSSDRGDGIHGITVDPEGNLYATGFTYGEMSDLATNEGDADIWLARLGEMSEDKDDVARVVRQYIASLLSTGEDADRANAADLTPEDSNSTEEEESSNAADLTPEDSDSTEEEENSNEANNFNSILTILSG
ncbi:MAG: SBBP repeat-containing protein [Spirulina sp.]